MVRVRPPGHPGLDLEPKAGTFAGQIEVMAEQRMPSHSISNRCSAESKGASAFLANRGFRMRGSMNQLRFFRSHGRIKNENASARFAFLSNRPGLPKGQIKLAPKYAPVRTTRIQSRLMGSPKSLAIS